MIDLDISTMPLVFIDVETTGFVASKCRVIELAAIRVENGSVVARLSTFLKIDDEVPEKITELTGITADHLKNAPVFADVVPMLNALLDGAIFVAHNAKFDYGFIKEEYARLDKEFIAITLCTVEMARSLYPQWPDHKLGTVIKQHKFEVSARHRAEDDASVLVEFLNAMSLEFTPVRVLEVAKKVLA